MADAPHTPLRPPIPNGIALPARGLETRDLNPQESVQWIEQFITAAASHRRFSFDVISTKAPDGTLTLVITPQNP